MPAGRKVSILTLPLLVAWKKFSYITNEQVLANYKLARNETIAVVMKDYIFL